jgi:hypothetical protein
MRDLDTRLGDFSHPHPKLNPLLLATFITMDCSRHFQNLARMPFTHPRAPFQILDQRAAPRVVE